MSAVAGEVASDRRYTGGDTLDEPVSTTIVPPHPSPKLPGFECGADFWVVTRREGGGVESEGSIVADEIVFRE